MKHHSHATQFWKRCTSILKPPGFDLGGGSIYNPDVHAYLKNNCRFISSQAKPELNRNINFPAGQDRKVGMFSRIFFCQPPDVAGHPLGKGKRECYHAHATVLLHHAVPQVCGAGSTNQRHATPWPCTAPCYMHNRITQCFHFVLLLTAALCFASFAATLSTLRG